MFKKILIAVVLISGVFAVLVSMRPDEFQVSRTIRIAAAPERIFPYVNNVQSWDKWSPWAKIDPQAKFSYEGPAEGVGAISRWDGNNEVGTGSMTVIESRPNEYIKFDLEFLKPFAGHNTADFVFKSEADKTTVTWSMSGKNNFITKAVGLFLNCDKMVGDQFEKGLENLKALSEK